MNSLDLHFRIAIEQIMGGLDVNNTTEETCKMVESTFKYNIVGCTTRINGKVERSEVSNVSLA